MKTYINLTHHWPYTWALYPETPIGQTMTTRLLDGIAAEERKTEALFKRLEGTKR